MSFCYNKLSFERKMSSVSSEDRFSSMNVAGLKKYLQERGVRVNGYLKAALVCIARAIAIMLLPIDPNFECNDPEKELGIRLIIHDVAVPDPFTLPTQNNFDDSRAHIWTLRSSTI